MGKAKVGIEGFRRVGLALRGRQSGLSVSGAATLLNLGLAGATN